jgi:hypothetical protein
MAVAVLQRRHRGIDLHTPSGSVVPSPPRLGVRGRGEGGPTGMNGHYSLAGSGASFSSLLSSSLSRFFSSGSRAKTALDFNQARLAIAG